ncbi:hypothetical protein AB0L65_46330 [Nonomuraea sp. NPDC052116]|uniref:hypothetical protein n=1 Tax=Nonomuraea sp. NPDC052116 TaxID=3155665 RepID=UPI00342419DE
MVGLVLKGSHAHDGMVTEHSDHDLYVVLADGAATDLTRFTCNGASSPRSRRRPGVPGTARCWTRGARTST